MLRDERVQEWFRKIELARKWKKPFEDTWDRTIGYLKGRFFDDLSEEDRVCVNMVAPHVRVVIPATYSQNPSVVVNPRLPDDEDDIAYKRANIMQRILRYQFKELNIKEEIKLCLLDGILTGNMCAKTGYETEFEEDEEVSVPSKTYVDSFLQLMGIKEKEEAGEDKFYDNIKIVYESAWAARVSPYHMIFPAMSIHPNNLPWIGQIIIKSYEDVMDFGYANTRNLKPSCSAADIMKLLRGRGYTDQIGIDDEMCILYEIWNGKDKKVCTLCEGYNEYLDEKDSKFTYLNSKYHPFVMKRLNDIPDELFGTSDVEPAEPQIEELNSTRTQMIIHRKRYNRKYKGRAGALSASDQTKLEEGKDGTYIEIGDDFDDKALDDILTPIQDAPLPAEAYQSANVVKDDLFTILGTYAYTSQSTNPAGSATEAQITATQSQFRVAERMDIIGDFVTDITRNIMMINQRFMTQEQVAEIVGKDAMYWEQLFDDKEIRNEHLLEVDYISGTPYNTQAKKAEFAGFYASVKDDPMYNQYKVRLEYVKRMELDHEPESWLNPEVVQANHQQQLIDAKMAALMAGTSNAPQDGENPPQLNGSAGRVPDLTKRGSRPLRERQAAGGTSRSRVPGRKGGTAASVY